MSAYYRISFYGNGIDGMGVLDYSRISAHIAYHFQSYTNGPAQEPSINLHDTGRTDELTQMIVVTAVYPNGFSRGDADALLAGMPMGTVYHLE